MGMLGMDEGVIKNVAGHPRGEFGLQRVVLRCELVALLAGTAEPEAPEGGWDADPFPSFKFCIETVKGVVQESWEGQTRGVLWFLPKNACGFCPCTFFAFLHYVACLTYHSI